MDQTIATNYGFVRRFSVLTTQLEKEVPRAVRDKKSAGVIAVYSTLFGIGKLGLPDRAPGLWLAAFGLFVICWGVGEVLSERPTTV